jgi:hypothetical protein
MTLFYVETSGNRTVEIDITSVSHWFKPYIGWIGDDNGETLTTEIRASFDNGSSWTSWTVVDNRDELTAAFDEDTESHADIIEVKQTLETTDELVSPTVECVFIYFPDFDPYFVTDLPSLSCEINVYNHVDFEASLPSLLLDADVHSTTYDRSADFEAALPALTGSIGSGAGLIESLPSLTLELDGDAGHKIDFKSTLPSLTAEWYAGGRMVATLPTMTLSADLSKDEPVDFVASLPSLKLSANILPGPMADMDCRIPSLSMTVSGDSELVAEISNSLPRMTLKLTGIAGNIGDIEGSLPTLKSRISSIVTGDNNIDASLPMFTALMESGDVSGVLRYVKGYAR